MDRLQTVVDNLIAPLVVITVTAVGGWGVWATLGVLNADNHIKQTQEINEELRAVTSRLETVERGFLSINAAETLERQETHAQLNEILDRLQ